jgi:hypothetical protein
VTSIAAETARQVASIGANTNLEYALGRSAADFAADSDAVVPFAARAWGGKLGVAALALGSILLLWRATRRTEWRPFDTVLAVWICVYPVYLWLGNVEKIYPHYFVALYPVPFVLAAMPADFLARTAGRAGRVAAGAILAAMVLAQVGTLAAFRSYVHTRGGTAGDYGIAYHHKRELADWAVGAKAVLADRRGREVRFLMGGDRAAEARGEEPATRFVIVDHLRSGSDIPAQCASLRRFGPLSACILD